MGKFSGAVKLQDLSDFIAPSQACVVKLDGSKKLDLQADVVGEVRPGQALSLLAAFQLRSHACTFVAKRVQLYTGAESIVV